MNSLVAVVERLLYVAVVEVTFLVSVVVPAVVHFMIAQIGSGPTEAAW